ncbi:C39 family peptidase [Massilia sp. RP-1-19]|uniref:C39 family peptidase n=1 Tax=Massilia polaris TaxID=2728846 RepID=A0A848HD11_9BURK|nr:C39 family peptidase [Massilia polaris]NML59706.1 C39 family peptidase [Massilia polaris]
MRSTLYPVLLTLAMALGPPAQAIEFGVGSLQVKIPVTSIKQARMATTTRQQFDFSCGSAAVATLLTYHYNRPVTEHAVFEQMFRDGDKAKIRTQGFSLLDMQKFLATRGLRGDGFKLPLEKLFEAKLPAIVLISDRGYNHFVVVKGMADGRILIGDPSRGTRAMSLNNFQQIWKNKLLFVIHGYNGMPEFNGAADWRAAPIARLDDPVSRTALDMATLPRFGPGEF